MLLMYSPLLCISTVSMRAELAPPSGWRPSAHPEIAAAGTLLELIRQTPFPVNDDCADRQWIGPTPLAGQEPVQPPPVVKHVLIAIRGEDTLTSS